MKQFFKTTFTLMALLCCIGLYNTTNAQTNCFANGECTCTLTITVTSTGPWTAQVGRFGAGVCDNIAGGPGVDVFTYTVEADAGGSIGYAIIFNSGNPITSVQITGCGINTTQSGGFVQFRPVSCETDCCAPPTNLTVTPSQLVQGNVIVCADPSPAECGEFSYFLRYRPVGSATWTDIGGLNDNCRAVGGLDPCTEYEFQMYAWREECETISDFSASVFYTTDCIEECCEAPASFTITPSATNPALLEICTDAYPDECGQVLYHVRWREVGTTTWIEINGGIDQKCQFVGEFEPCTQYEIQMNVFTEGCNGYTDYSASQFYTTECEATDCFANSECTCQVTVSITPLTGSAWTGTIGRIGAGPCDNINGPAGTTSNFVYNVDANAAGTITYGYFPSGGFVPVNITVTGCGLNLNFNMTTPSLFTFNPVASCLTGNGGSNRSDNEAAIAAIEAGAWGAVYNTVTITPNPANDLLQITTTSTAATYNELININGQVVAQTTVEANGSAQVDVSQLAAGIYILRTTNRISGEVIANEKVVVKH